jgi:hypothetical protein
MKNLFICAICTFTLLLSGCGSSTQKNKYEGPSPVDLLMRDLASESSYSIILHDMEVNESKKIYKHKYKVSKNITDSTKVKPTITDWANVTELFFAENMNNMGLELASKSAEGTVSKIPSPPGFNGVVGNKQYGEWRSDNSGQSFWHFYGQYMFMSSMLNMASRPVYRDSYYHYSDYRNNPNTRNTPYYGTGNNTYGTNSASARSTNPSFFERKQTQQQMSSFKEKVASNPKSYTRARSDDNSSARTPRSSSRAGSNSSSGSSSRSRGGGFGK